MTAFSKKVLDIIGAIPRGKVFTYGMIAKICGSPHGARQVARLLHSCSGKYNLPWHRVINSRGEISLEGPSFDLQRSLLEEEGIEVAGKRIDLNIYLWKGPAG